MLREWPGNVRELRAAIRSLARDKGAKELRAEDLDPDVGTRAAAPTAPAAPTARSPTSVSREQLEAALAEHGGNRSAVARALGLHRSQLYRLLEQYGLDS